MTARLWILNFVAIASLPAAMSGAAVQTGGALQHLSGMAVLDGTCHHLVIPGHDLTAGCQGTVVNSMYESIGRTGFSFGTRDNTVVTFSGMDTPAKGDHAAVVLDRVIFTLKNTQPDPTKTKPTALSATGTCTYTNPYAGPSHIDCSASTKDGPFSASFVSDGKAPDIKHF